MCVCVLRVSVSVCAHSRSTKRSVQPWKQAISHERSCSLPAPCNKVKIVIRALFRKMAANQKPLNQIGIFWYQFTPRKLLYLMIPLNLVKICPHWLSVLGGHPVYDCCVIMSFFHQFSTLVSQVAKTVLSLNKL